MTLRDAQRIERFRRLALAMPEAVELPHFDLPSFRVGKRIFATIHEDDVRAMLKFMPEQQEEWIAREPAVFSPVPGRWGEAGATFADLRSARVTSLKAALAQVWKNVSPTRRAPGSRNTL